MPKKKIKIRGKDPNAKNKKKLLPLGRMERPSREERYVSTRMLVEALCLRAAARIKEEKKRSR